MNRFRVGQFVSIPRTNGLVTRAQITLIAADHVAVSWVEANGVSMGKDFSIPEFLVMMKKDRLIYFVISFFVIVFLLCLFATGVRSNYLQSNQVIKLILFFSSLRRI